MLDPFLPRRWIAAAFCVATSCAFGADDASPALAKPARAQDDLFGAVNGSWMAQTEIPADKADYGVWAQISDETDQRLRAIVDELSSGTLAEGGAKRQIALFYRAFVDEAAIDRAGLAPIQPLLAQIDQINNKAELATHFGRVQGVAQTPLAMWPEPDARNPSIYSANVWQSGLGLPDRDYYLKNGARFDGARKAYETYLATLMKLAGMDKPEAAAAQQLALEKRIAQVQWDRVRTREAIKTYNPTTLAQLERAAPGFAWKAFFPAASVSTARPLIIGQPSYAKAMAVLFAREPLSTWKTYAKLRALDAAADVLPAEFRQARFQFHGVALRGLKEPRPRWQKGLDVLNDALGEAVGTVYVERHFPSANKARMQEMVGQLMKAYGESIDGLSWMRPTTRAQARTKLAKYQTKIGYPDRWRDYTALEIREGDAFGNDQRAGRFEWARQAAKISQPVDRQEWGMTPQTINAYYDPGRNEIVFPAAILQPPFFDMAADDASNYGAIGAIIGHEISHGFDDQGSQFDGDGKLRNWWTAEDRKAFDALGARLVAQFNTYQPLPGQHLNGKLTLGENIADLSGLQIAFKAYQNSLVGKTAPVIDGKTGEQRFFIGWAAAWREKVRDERAQELLTSDPHSPSRFRANGAAINHDAFHAAFGTRPGDGMYKAPADRIHIW